MGLKRNTNMDKDKEQAINRNLNLENDIEDKDLRGASKSIAGKVKNCYRRKK